MIEITHSMNEIAKELVGVVSSIPSLTKIYFEDIEKDVNHFFFDVISSNKSVLEIVEIIINGMALTATEVKKVIFSWDVFKSLWEVDRETFVRQYKNNNCIEDSLLNRNIMNRSV